MTHPAVVERLTSTNVHRLFTFAAPKEVHEYLRYCDQRGIRARIMLDSGAFTAWNIGKPVRLQDLIEYDLGLLKQYPQHQFVFIALDVIPGARGRTATEAEIGAAVEESYANFCTMLQALPGQYVLPVYHSGEQRRIRDRYLSHTKYLCLSMNQNLSEGERLRWAREAITPDAYYHGLAATGNAMLKTVDWYSVDSSGWLMTAAMGSILFPVGDELRPVSISSTAPSLKDDNKHIFNMGEGRWLVDFIRSRGYDEEILSTRYEARICWNIDMWNNPPWIKNPVQPIGLFEE
jgi:hypothetical protein